MPSAIFLTQGALETLPQYQNSLPTQPRANQLFRFDHGSDLGGQHWPQWWLYRFAPDMTRLVQTPGGEHLWDGTLIVAGVPIVLVLDE